MTGVQTCALPIYHTRELVLAEHLREELVVASGWRWLRDPLSISQLVLKTDSIWLGETCRNEPDGKWPEWTSQQTTPRRNIGQELLRALAWMNRKPRAPRVNNARVGPSSICGRGEGNFIEQLRGERPTRKTRPPSSQQ